MIRYCSIIKKMIFDAKTFRVFWSKRGYWCSTSSAGTMPGRNNGTIEVSGKTIKEANEKLDNSLQARREFFQHKINEIDKALFDIRTLGYEAEKLEK